MNNDQRKKNSGGSVVGFVIALAIILFGSIDSGAAPALALIIIVVAGVGIALAVAASKAKKAGSGSGGTEKGHTRREFTPEHFFDMGKLIKQNRGSLSKLLTEKMRDDLSECDDDHEHTEPDIHADPEEKRAAQLREMLKNGIIEKEEYNILMRKYGLK